MKTLKFTLKVTVLLVLTAFTLSAQDRLTIGIIRDADSKEFRGFSDLLKTEIFNISKSDYDVEFIERSIDMSRVESERVIQEMMQDANIDYVITLGYISSSSVSKLDTYSKPVIATSILDRTMQQMPLTEKNTSGVNNFTYIGSSLDLKENLKEFSRIFEATEVVIILPKALQRNFPKISENFLKEDPNLHLTLVTVGDQVKDIEDKIPTNTEAAYVLPMLGLEMAQVETLFKELNRLKIPSLAVNGVDYLNLGATFTMTPQIKFQQLARQIALRIMKVNEGVNPSDLNVDIDSYKQVSVVNMESVRATNKFPAWNILNESILINVTEFSSGKNMNLRMAISEGLENNLKGKMSLKDISISEKEVRIAKSNILPQISVGASTVSLSDNLVETSMGQRGQFTLTGSATLSQVIFSESVFANIKINKLMAENKRFYNDQVILDVVSNVSMSYIGLLFAKSNVLIQNENVNSTMKNLKMTRVKEEAGQVGFSDVNRWVTELNMNKITFNDAYTTYVSSMYQINQQLNTNISETINISDSISIGNAVVGDKDVLKRIFENPILTEKYASFIIQEMRINSPEIHQLESLISVIEQQNKLYKRQAFMPELAAFANADQAFIRNGAATPEGLPVPPPPDDLTFYFGLNLKIPVFQGGRSVAQTSKSLMEIEMVNYQKEEVFNALETGIRSSVQKLRTSYLELELSKNAAKAAEANFNSVQEAYFHGAVSIIQLIDAQNVMNSTKHMANISYYQYILDYLIVQRYQGKFLFLSPEDEQSDYSSRLQSFLINK